MHRQYKESQKAKKSMFKRMIKPSLVLVLFVYTICATFSYPMPTKADSNVDQLLQQNQQYQQQLNSLYAQQNSLANQIAIANTQAAAIQSQINLTSAQLQDVNNQIDKTNQDITAAQANLDKQKVLLGEYIKTMYVNSQTSQIELILTSSSFSDFVDQSQYLDSMTQQVQNTTNQIESLKKDLDSKKKDLLTQQDKINSLLASQTDQKSALNAQNDQTSSLLAQSKNSAAAVSGQIAKNNSQLNILRAIASGNTGGVINGNLIVVNQSFFVNGVEHSYESQRMYGQGAYIQGNSNADDNFIDMYNSGCLVTSLAMAYGETPAQEAARHRFSYSYMEDSGGSAISSSAADSLLANGSPVIFGIDWNGDGYADHYILCFAHTDGKYYIDDPYFGAGKEYSSSEVVKYLKP